MSHQTTDTDLDLALDEPVKLPRQSQGPDTARVVFAILALLVITVLLAGALGFSMRESL